MSVLALMYHRTPRGAAEDGYDVALPTFFEQIERLIDAGASFVRFSQVNAAENLGAATRVAVTFDDGHASNEEAFAYLADRRIVPAAMIVSDWSRNDPACLSRRGIADFKEVCEFGGHGASHVALSSLDPAALDRELAASRDFLANALGERPRFMALPGGKGNAGVIGAARRAGFELVGNSRPLRHERAAVSVDRICVTRAFSAAEPARLANAGAAFWLARRAKFAASQVGPQLFGPARYAALRRLAKRS